MDEACLWQSSSTAPIAMTCALAEATLDHIMVERPVPSEENPQHLCLDAGYDYDAVYEIVRAHHYVPHIRPNQHNRAQAKPSPEFEEGNSNRLESTKRPRRWVVERLHSWLNRSRRLLVRLSTSWIRPLKPSCIWLVVSSVFNSVIVFFLSKFPNKLLALQATLEVEPADKRLSLV